MTSSRRDFFRLAGGALWIAGCATSAVGREAARATGPVAAPPKPTGFLLVQISDTHWGYSGPANPDPRAGIVRAIDEIAAWPQKPDLVIHTGDVTHLTADAGQRKARLAEAKAAFARLGVPMRLLPGEHDASLDAGAAFAGAFGDTRWAFEHAGVYFIGLDNASDAKGGLGEAQLAWFEREVAKVPKTARLFVFAHRPLYALAEPWDWYTADGDRAVAILEQHPGTTVFFGHIHQALAAKTGATTHVSVRSLAFPMPLALSTPEKKPLPWDANAIDHGLGYRGIVVENGSNGMPVWVDRALVG
jgi:3',5'-cyclic AMP phosphodiesterase CpdA